MLQMPSNIHGICCSLNHDLHSQSTRHNSKNAYVTCFSGMNIVLKQFTTVRFFPSYSDFTSINYNVTIEFIIGVMTAYSNITPIMNPILTL